MTSNQRIFRALFAVALILGIAMGTRNAFSGLFLQPVSADMKWGREVFSFAVALQNLVWGASQPFIGYIADRYGARRVLIAGAVLYALGLGWTAFLSNTFTLAISGGILMGVAIACTTYSVAYSVLGKMVPPERRAWAFGISAAAGSCRARTLTRARSSAPAAGASTSQRRPSTNITSFSTPSRGTSVTSPVVASIAAT